MVGHGTNTGLLMGMAVNICWFVLCVCFYLRCIIILKHFHWLATNFASIPTCIEGCFQEVLLLFLHCNVNFIDFRGLVIDFRAVF